MPDKQARALASVAAALVSARLKEYFNASGARRGGGPVGLAVRRSGRSQSFQPGPVRSQSGCRIVRS
eukprot:4774484-Alexandrium_andersonii.AAC.1